MKDPAHSRFLCFTELLVGGDDVIKELGLRETARKLIECASRAVPAREASNEGEIS